MRRSSTIIIVVASLILVALFLTLRSRHAPIPRSTLAYAPSRADHAAPLTERSRVVAPSTSRAQEAARPSGEFGRALGPPRWHPRPDGEWQGMLVNLNAQPPCDGPALCGLARACKNGKCGPCELDADCATGESCVLDHCVRSENVGCRRRADCGPRSTCILSGYSAGVRGNQNMRAYCVALESGAKHGSPVPGAPPEKDPRLHLPNDDLLKAANNARQR
jgi:hypothetical protein